MAWDKEELDYRENLILEIHFYVQSGNMNKAQDILQAFWERAWDAGFDKGVGCYCGDN